MVCATLLGFGSLLVTEGVAYAGSQCAPGYKPLHAPPPERVCIITTISNLHLTGARVNWTDLSAPVNDYNYATSGKGCAIGHFTIYGRGWTTDSPTRNYCQANLDGVNGDGFSFDFQAAPRAVQDGELVCGKFLKKTASGFAEWGEPACEKE